MPRKKITDGTKIRLLRTYPSEREVEVLGEENAKKIATEAIKQAYINSIKVTL